MLNIRAPQITRNNRRSQFKKAIITNDESDVSHNGNDSKYLPNLILSDVLRDEGSEEAVRQSGTGAEEGGDEDHGEVAAQAEAHHPC